MPVSNFHSNAQRVFYSGFNGGLNLSVPNESLPKNELKEAVNVEFSPKTGCMKVRGGLVWAGRFPDAIPISDVVPVRGRRGFLARVKNTGALNYFRWNNIWPVAQAGVSWLADWRGTMSIVPWVEKIDTDYDGENDTDRECWLLTAGGSLQKFTDTPVPSLTTITTAPANARLVFVRDGRVGLVCVVDGEERVMLSKIGNCESWINDPDNEESAQSFEIGYKDGMKIDAVVPLSKDLIIFKSPEGEPDKGIIYRLTGSSTLDYQILEVAHNTGTFSQQSVCVVGNDVFYATVAGIATLSTVTNYGEVRTGWPDRKVNNALTPELDATARVYDIPVKQQLWIAPSEDSNKIWCFDYARSIWTTFDFPAKIIYAAGVDNQLFVFIGRDLYEIIDDYPHDELYGSAKKIITAKMRLGTILSGMQTLIKTAFASFDLKPGCKAELVLGKWKMKFAHGGTEDYIYDPPNDTQYACEDDDPLFPQGGVLTSRRHCIVRDWSITPEIIIEGGGCAVSTIGLEIAEV